MNGYKVVVSQKKVKEHIEKSNILKEYGIYTMKDLRKENVYILHREEEYIEFIATKDWRREERILIRVICDENGMQVDFLNNRKIMEMLKFIERVERVPDGPILFPFDAKYGSYSNRLTADSCMLLRERKRCFQINITN